MGFELNRIMKQYGVGTPGIANYSGAAAPLVPTTPAGTRPVGEDDAAKASQTAYDKQLADFNAYKADPAVFNEMMRKYGLDQKSYDTYKTDYQNRLQNTPMYIQSQFDTGNRPVSDAMKLVTTGVKNNATGQGIGVDKFYANTRGYVADNPYASTQANQDYMKSKGISNQDVYNATGSYYGNQLRNPTYGAMNASMINDTPQARSDYYLQQRNLGYNNADLRTASENTFGKVNEGDWAQLTARAYPTYNANIVDAYKSIGRTWEPGSANGQIDPGGYNYWMNQLSSGAFDPKNLNSTFAQAAADEKARSTVKAYTGGSVHDLAAKYAQGGGVSSPGQAAAYYKQRARDGYSDSEIRASSDSIFGVSSDAEWQYIKNIANVSGTPTSSAANVVPIGIAGNSNSGGGDSYVDPNPGWSGLSKSQQAAYFADPKNHTEADLRGLAQKGFSNFTTFGLLQNLFSPSIPIEAAMINAGIDPGTGLQGQGSRGQTGLHGDKGVGFNPDGSVKGYDPSVYDSPTSYDPGDQAGSRDGIGLGTGDGGMGSGGGRSAGDSTGTTSSTSSDTGTGNPAESNARGGRIKTHYQTAGEVRLPSGYGSIDEEEDFNRRFRTQPEAVPSPVNMTVPPAPVTIEPVPATVIGDAPKSVLTEIATRNLKTDPMPAASTEVAPVPIVAVPKAALPGGERMATMQAMLAAYGPKDGAYDKELKTARDRATADSDAFTKMLTDSMKSPEDAQSSKAEMYFRLAAAFGAPTKTGQFSENLGMVGKELGEYAKGKRASAREKQLLGLEVQKLKMASSKEDLNTLRALAGKEMDDKRAIATELIKDYIKSGEPQSTAGKQALDEGLKPGSKEYQDRVAAIGNMNVEAKLGQINSALASMTTQAAMLALAQNKFENVKDQQAKLTGPEVELKIKTQDMLGSTKQAMDDLKRAYALNDNTFDTSVVDTAQRKLLEAAGSKDPKVLNTREQENLLQKGALAQLKSTFPGAISDAETKTLQALQGLGSKSKEERALIMKNAFRTLQAIEKRSQLRLLEITQGSFRETVPVPQGLE